MEETKGKFPALAIHENPYAYLMPLQSSAAIATSGTHFGLDRAGRYLRRIGVKFYADPEKRCSFLLKTFPDGE